MKTIKENKKIYRGFKYCRYKHIIEGNYRYAFCYQALIYNLCTGVDVKLVSSIGISDLFEISKAMFAKAFHTDAEDVYLFQFSDVIMALGNKKTFRAKSYIDEATFPLLSRIVMHIDMLDTLYNLENELPGMASLYFNNITSIYANRYGSESNAYAQMLLHIIGEVIVSFNVDLALKLLEQYKHLFNQALDKYPFQYVCHLLLAAKLFELQRYEENLEVLDSAQRLINKIDITPEQRIDYTYECGYARGQTLIRLGKYDILIHEFSYYISMMDSMHPLYSAFCLEIANGYFHGYNDYDQSEQWVRKGLDYYDRSLSEKDGSYYKLIQVRAIISFKKGNKAIAMKDATIALTGLKTLYGEQSDEYATLFTDLAFFSDDAHIWADFKRTLGKRIDTLPSRAQALIYNNMASSGKTVFYDFKEEPPNYKLLQECAEKAIHQSELAGDHSLLLRSKLTLLNCLVQQSELYSKNNAVINNLFDELNTYFSSQPYTYSELNQLYDFCKHHYAQYQR